MTGFRRRTVLLGLLTYAFGLIPFYFLTPVQPGVQDILRQTAMAATGAPTTGAAATTPTSSGSWFLYSAKGDLWETNVAQTLQLTHVGHYSQPALDGESLVYVEREKSYSDLWLLQPGAAPRRVTHNASADVASNQIGRAHV